MIELDIQALRPRVGEEIAVSDWVEITQARIDQFADATGIGHVIILGGADRATPGKASAAVIYY